MLTPCCSRRLFAQTPSQQLPSCCTGELPACPAPNLHSAWLWLLPTAGCTGGSNGMRRSRCITRWDSKVAGFKGSRV